MEPRHAPGDRRDRCHSRAHGSEAGRLGARAGRGASTNYAVDPPAPLPATRLEPRRPGPAVRRGCSRLSGTTERRRSPMPARARGDEPAREAPRRAALHRRYRRGGSALPAPPPPPDHWRMVTIPASAGASAAGRAAQAPTRIRAGARITRSCGRGRCGRRRSSEAPRRRRARPSSVPGWPRASAIRRHAAPEEGGERPQDADDHRVGAGPRQPGGDQSREAERVSPPACCPPRTPGRTRIPPDPQVDQSQRDGARTTAQPRGRAAERAPVAPRLPDTDAEPDRQGAALLRRMPGASQKPADADRRSFRQAA